MISAARFFRAHWAALSIGAVCLASALIKLPHLGHQHLAFDEVCHAIVARNLLKHPFTPTLYDAPYLPYDYESWTSNHVWLHKPILPLWKIAASYAVFGVNTFALRFPSLLLATLAVFLTYLIGKRLFDRRAALIAAAVQAFLPVMAELTHGYLFSDAIDISLLFWTELAVYFLIRAMQSGSWRDVLIAGAAQGCAYLSKSYLALIVTGIALAIWLAPALRLGRRENIALRGRHLLGLTAASLVVALPWTISTAIRFPQEFHYEHSYVFRHLVSDVESWAAPWDRLLFDYFPFLLHIFFAAAMASAVTLSGRLFTKKKVSLCVVYAWGFGVLIPHLFAATKTPSATLLALPAFLLIFGELAVRGVFKRESRWELCVLTGISLTALALPQTPPHWGKGTPEGYVFGSLILERPWPMINLAAVFAVAWAALQMAPRLEKKGLADSFRWACIGFAIAGSFTLALRAVWITSAVAGGQGTPAPYLQVAEYAREELPANAVLFVERAEGMGSLEHLKTMFHADRTAYRLNPRSAAEQSETVRQKGGVSYLLSIHRYEELKVVHGGKENEAAIYAWPSTAPDTLTPDDDHSH